MAGHYRGRVTGPGIDEDVCAHCFEVIYFDPGHFDGSWLHRSTQFMACWHPNASYPKRPTAELPATATPAGAGAGAPTTEPQRSPWESPTNPATPAERFTASREAAREAEQYRYEKNLATTLSALAEAGIEVEGEDLTRLKAAIRTYPEVLDVVLIDTKPLRRRRFPLLLIPGVSAMLVLAAIGYGAYALWAALR